MPSLSTHQPPPWCPSSSFTACLWLTYLTSLPYTLVPCPTHPYVFSVFFLDQQKRPFSGPHKLLFLSPIGLLSGHVRAQRFHSAPWSASGNWGPLFRFPPASYIIQNFWPGDYSACHLPSCWLVSCSLDSLDPEDGGYVPPICWLTFHGLHSVISQKTVLFITTAVRISNPTWIFYDCAYNTLSLSHC
jgi:hypothetical protein